MGRFAGGLLVLLAAAAVAATVAGSGARAGACSPCFSGDALFGVAVAPDGRIVAVGVDGVGTNRPGLLLRRYLPGGGLDPSFADGGQETLTDVFASSLAIRVSAVGPDGRFLVWDEYHVASFGADGQLDPAFGDAGVVAFPYPEFLVGVVRLADGRAIVASQNTGIRRLEADGSIDTGYGSQGIVDTSKLFGIRAIALAPDGSLLVAGQPPGGGVVLIRLLADGRIDRAFGRDGVVALAADDRYTVTLAARADGRILVGLAPYLERLLPDGSPDPGFGSGGKLNVSPASFAPLPDGKTVVLLSGGTLLRLLPDGSLDPSFGSGGFVDAVTGYPRAMAAAADGSVFVAGSTSSLGGHSVLAHYQRDGTPDLRFTDFALGRSDLYSASLQHGYRRLSQTALISGPLTISPDRHRIAYLSDRTGSEQLYTAAADGSHEQRVTGGDPGDPALISNGPIVYWQPNRIGWSPQGDRIAFTAARTPCLVGESSCDPAGTWIVNADGSDPHQLAAGATFLSWSPDGRQVLLLDLNGRVMAASIDGGRSRFLANANDAAWSPRANEIALRVPHARGESIELVRPNGRLIAKLGPGAGAGWAPNGRELWVKGDPSISLFRSDGRLLTVLRDAIDPQWTPDGRLAYENRSGVQIADARGHTIYKTKRVSLVPFPLTPAWTSPTTFIVLRFG